VGERIKECGDVGMAEKFMALEKQMRH